MKTNAILLTALLLAPLAALHAADTGLVLLRDGRSDYQIVVPDKLPTEALTECLNQTARLVQTAFKANGADVSVVAESKRDTARPAIYLGNTDFARQQGVNVAKVKGWGYVQRAVERDVIIAGRDEAAPDEGGPVNQRRPKWDRVGTAKGVADFLRQFAGVRFLYPDLDAYAPVSGAAKIDLLNSPAIEFLPTPIIIAPAALNVEKTPVIEFNVQYQPRGSFYDIANNRFPIVDTKPGVHTYESAIPVEKYFATHPEYFALIGGQRLKAAGGAQYCISNPEVQELMYQDMLAQMDSGYAGVGLGQPDGFRPCQCEPCKKLYDTGDDWSEKLWIFHRKLAERLLAARPDRRVTMMSYILTAAPPKSFKKFPANTQIMLTGTNEEDIAPWRGHEVPQGFCSYLYNWCPNLGTRYTPMRTPGFVETQVKRLVANHIQSVMRDGPGILYGLEGPVYYTMGRMFDDAEHNEAKVLVHEFCGAAFGKSAPPMLQFYDQLYRGIEIYSRYLGTRDPGWAYTDIYGRRQKHLSDPLQLLGFLYTPDLLTSLDAKLTQAEKLANTDKTKVRLALVRREFDYLRGLARVVHLYHAYRVQPDRAMRDRLLDAIDARNAEIATYFDNKGWTKATPGWAFTFFPPVGHDAKHLRLAYDGYQEPYANTVFNWDTKALRNAPLEGAKRITAGLATSALTLDSPQWQKTQAGELVSLPGSAPVTRKTTLRTVFDEANVYLFVESELPAALMKPNAGAQQESLALYLAPIGGRDLAYRFTVGLSAESKSDAACGLVTDVMDPRHGQFDPDWSGEWKYETRLEPEKNRWLALLKIPFKTLGVEAPRAGAFWHANVGRVHVASADRIERSLWSVTPGTKSLEDRNDFGELAFAAAAGTSSNAQPDKHPLQVFREDYYRKTFEIPAEWKTLTDPLPTPLANWVFHADPLEQGIKNGWHAADFKTDDWVPIKVPSFWAENEAVGDIQGDGWYRTTFTVPADWRGKSLRLLFASVDEQAWVYVNGQLVREHSEKSEKKSFNDLWEAPFTADVPAAHLNYGKTNVLAVRVHNSTANGGIWRPVLAQGMEGK